MGVTVTHFNLIDDSQNTGNKVKIVCTTSFLLKPN
jgi:hypothetical protein